MKYLKKYKLFEKVENFRNCSGMMGRNIFNQFVYIFNSSIEENGCGGDVNDTNDRGVTLLQQAVYYLDLEIVKYLLEKGANPNKESKSGETPILELGEKIDNDINSFSEDEDFVEILKLLLEYGADLNHKNHNKQDFFDLVRSPKQKEILISYIPKKYYDNYLLNKELNKFNI